MSAYQNTVGFEQGMKIAPMGARPLGLALGLTLLLAFAGLLPDFRLFSHPENYLPLHTGLEFLSMAVSAMVVALGWNMRDTCRNSHAVMLGAVFLYLGLADFAHTLSYQGMPDFVTPSSHQKAINFWLGGRLGAVVGLFAVALLPVQDWSRFRSSAIFGLALLASALVWWVGLFHADWLPATYTPGSGLTTFKSTAEYLLAILYGLAAVDLYRQRAFQFDGAGPWLAAGTWLLGLVGLFFAAYSDATDLFNLCGHIYKALAYWMIYRALFATAVQAPYRALQEQEARQEQLVRTRTAEVQAVLSRYRTLIQSAPVAMAMLDRDLNYLAVSRQWIESFGNGHHTLIGRNHYEVQPDCPWGRRSAHQAALAGETVRNEAECEVLADNRRRWWRWAAYPWLDERGAVAGIILFDEDITGYKLAEEAAREHGERLSLALQAGRSGAFEWDASTNLCSWSDELLDLYGLSRDRFGGGYGEWLDCVVPEDREIADRTFQEALKTGLMEVDFRIRHRCTGELRWLNSRAKVYFDPAGRPARMFGVDIDITDLKLARERLLLTLDAARMISFDYDADTRRLHRQGRMVGSLGLSEHEAAGRFLKRIHPEERQAFSGMQKGLAPDRPDYRIEYRIAMPDGAYRWLAEFGKGRFDTSGRLVGIQGVTMDIDAQKETALALAHEQELLNSIVDNIPVMLCLFDPQRQSFKLNRHAEAVLGWTTDEANDGDFMARVYPDPAYRLMVTDYMQQLLPGWRELQCSTRDGRLVPSEWASMALSDNTIVGIGLDLRQRKADEARLALHAWRQAILLELASGFLQAGGDSASLARIIFDRVSTHLDADVCLSYRLPPGAGELELVAGFGIPASLGEAVQRLRLGESFSGTVALARKPLVADRGRIACDGEGGFARCLGLRAYACHPLFGLEGQVIGTFSLGSTRRDSFTPEEGDFIQTIAYFLAHSWERRRAEEEIQRLNSDLERRVDLRTAELAQANEALIRSNLELQRFAHVAAHDLQTPLRSIVGFSQLLHKRTEGRLDSRAEEYIRLVVDNTRRMQVLINDLLVYSRLDSQARSLERTDLGELFDQVLSGLTASVAEAEAVVVRGALPTLAVDRTQLAQVFSNLVENGIKYNRSGDVRVEVSASRQGSEWMFAVQDNGIGIDPRHHPQIFTMFKRLHTHHAYPGSGVGLAICQRVIERHGGRIWVESAEGAGSTFFFTLPASDKIEP